MSTRVTRNGPAPTTTRAAGDKEVGTSHGRTGSSTSTPLRHADGFQRAADVNKFSASTPSGSQSVLRPPSPPPNALTDPGAAKRWQDDVTAQSDRPTIATVAKDMTTPGTPVNAALAAVQPPLPMSPVNVMTPKILGVIDGVPRVEISGVTADQLAQLEKSYNIDTGNPLHAGETNRGMRSPPDGDTLYRMNATQTGMVDGKPTYTVGFYEEQLGPTAPPGQGARTIPIISDLLPGSVLRSGGDQPKGEPPSLGSKIGEWLYQFAEARDWPPA